MLHGGRRGTAPGTGARQQWLDERQTGKQQEDGEQGHGRVLHHKEHLTGYLLRRRSLMRRVVGMMVPMRVMGLGRDGGKRVMDEVGPGDHDQGQERQRCGERNAPCHGRRAGRDAGVRLYQTSLLHHPTQTATVRLTLLTTKILT